MSKTKSKEKIELKLFETESLCQSCLHRILGCFIANIFTDGAFKKKAPSPNIVLSIALSNIAYMSVRGEASLERGDECLHVSMRGT